MSKKKSLFKEVSSHRFGETLTEESEVEPISPEELQAVAEEIQRNKIEAILEAMGKQIANLKTQMDAESNNLVAANIGEGWLHTLLGDWLESVLTRAALSEKDGDAWSKKVCEDWLYSAVQQEGISQLAEQTNHTSSDMTKHADYTKYILHILYKKFDPSCFNKSTNDQELREAEARRIVDSACRDIGIDLDDVDKKSIEDKLLAGEKPEAAQLLARKMDLRFLTKGFGKNKIKSWGKLGMIPFSEDYRARRAQGRNGALSPDYGK